MFLLRARNALLALRRRLSRSSLPLRGWEEHRHEIPLLDDFDDDDLARLNELLEWRAFVADAQGRRFGDTAWRGKRDRPQAIPDPRIVLLDARVPLRDRSVLEIGCFEGIHTVALSQRARHVTATDARVENVIKTIVRCAMFGVRPLVRKIDVENDDAFRALGAFDVVHHIGVLYHLADPVRHLRALCEMTRTALLLDTHIATPETATRTYNGSFRYRHFAEGGRADVFSGMNDHAKWLLLEDIVRLLQEGGFAVEVLEQRDERNGPRVLLLATRGVI